MTVLITVVFATGLTLFYFLHEQLPRSVRAPSSFILAPVAIVDGLCYAAGIPGIYDKMIPIFIVNLLVAAVICLIGYRALNRWHRRT